MDRSPISRRTRCSLRCSVLAMVLLGLANSPAEAADHEGFSGLMSGAAEDIPPPPTDEANPFLKDATVPPEPAPLPMPLRIESARMDRSSGQPFDDRDAIAVGDGDLWEEDLAWEDDGFVVAGPHVGAVRARIHSWLPGWFPPRSASTHGRAIGAGEPLRGTSWLNRPIEATAEVGALIMTGPPANDIRAANDLFGAVQLGWDWDHYWGSQLRLGWSTPEMDNPNVQEADLSDNFLLTDASVVYYPWGDSRTRPYLRAGFGLVDLEFTNSNGERQQENLFTVPLAIGMKRLVKRNLAFRAEFANNVAFGANEADGANYITLSVGLEGRFGGKPDGYWAWSPRGGAW
ncbi:MAG: outer membrane beta-barrel protein [Planctomycetota bacterium]